MLQLYSKFCANTFIQYGDSSILQNSIAAILNLLGKSWLYPQGQFMVPVPCKNFVFMGLAVFIDNKEFLV